MAPKVSQVISGVQEELIEFTGKNVTEFVAELYTFQFHSHSIIHSNIRRLYGSIASEKLTLSGF